MKVGPEDFGGGARLRVADRASGRAVVLRAAAVATGKVQVMDFIIGFFELQQGPGHIELDVIRMSTDGNSNFVGHSSLDALYKRFRRGAWLQELNDRDRA